MTTYQIEVKQCPNCNCKFAVLNVGSCNTFGAKFYTDGFVSGPMYDEGDALLICPNCDKYFWREDIPTQEIVRDSEFFRDPAKRSLPNAKRVYARNYENTLRQALWKNKAQEKYIRIRAWWSFNSSYRSHPTKDFTLPFEQEANLRSLLQLLDTNDPYTSIIKAEILRELGEFNESLAVIDQTFDDRYLQVVDVIKRLAKSGNRQVGTIE